MKVLIISHGAMCTHNNMGKTIHSLFSKFKKEELCHLYLYPMIPDIDKCSSHYRITDIDVLKSYYCLKVCGKRIESADIDTTKHELFQKSSDEKLYRNQKNKTAFRVLSRDAMWKCAHWFNKDLKDWIHEQKPTCIFVAPGMPKLLYDIALKISKKYNLPMVVYICDDYYFMCKDYKAKSLFEKIQNSLLVSKTKKLLKNAKHIVTICDELADSYKEEFGVPATTVMTGTSYPIANDVVHNEVVNRLTYMGNIRYNRYINLSEIGIALDRYNEREGRNCVLEIYSAEKDKNILSVFEGIKSVKLCGFVGGDDFDRVFRSSEMFIHTESFDEFNIRLTQRSVSTKIADCLGSGIPLFAYGPDCIASIGHLKRNHAAITVSSRSELYEVLSKCLENPDDRDAVAKKGIDTAKLFHTAEKQSEKLYNILAEI